MPLFDTYLTISDVSGLQAALDQKAKDVVDAWQDLPLSANWSNYAVGVATPQCRKLLSNLVEVKGVIKKSTALVANEIITTLPVGYRPAEIVLLATWASGGTSRIQVEPSGVIRLLSGNNSGVGLNFFFGL
jgi:hypothetical protein